DIRAQSWPIKLLFIGIFLIVPGVLWIAFTVLFAHLSRNYLQQVRQAEAQSCTIELDQNENVLSYQSESSMPQKVAYNTIRKASVTYPVGVRDGDKYLLTLDTTNGPIILLPEALGTQVQKQDLAEKIEQAISHNLPK
ncbi:MAG: hypothetical protein R3264_00400, partial [Anaerolineae bacterium]|nr:hypothetical protein [Anaerolineae bacterium]